ncbi:phasin family protein [Marinobacter sp. X15-166B]|uniref:phasin family protein n=1 Tax=Marinobacter sp. X15-166B TaxID=1897620 RepID=UPI00085C9528|nr:phasin family protein [Marinobacter sp. X15-166B]OEY65696.1 hypothetical protein BG841_03975 [Marinobacter sp. X15-166B]
MFDTMTEQLQQSLNPVNELVAKNASVLVQAAEQQTQWFADLVNASVACTRSLTAQTDLPGVVNVQKAYAGEVQNTLVAASKTANTLIAEVQANVGEAVKPFVPLRHTAAQ